MIYFSRTRGNHHNLSSFWQFTVNFCTFHVYVHWFPIVIIRHTKTRQNNSFLNNIIIISFYSHLFWENVLQGINIKLLVFFISKMTCLKRVCVLKPIIIIIIVIKKPHLMIVGGVWVQKVRFEYSKYFNESDFKTCQTSVFHFLILSINTRFSYVL